MHPSSARPAPAPGHAWLGLMLFAFTAVSQAQPASPLQRADPASSSTVLAPKQPVLKKKPGPPRQCKPGEMSDACLARSEQAFRLIMEVATECPDCVPEGAVSRRPMHAGKPVRPREFCDAVEKLARIEGMRVTCTAP